MLLTTDVSGVATWHFAEPGDTEGPALRGGSTRTYVVRARAQPRPESDAMRGLLGFLGAKVVKILAFKLVDDVAGRVGDYFAGRWERHKRPYRTRTFDPGDYTHATGRALAQDDWERLSSGRALLFVHGTFSRAHNGFGALPPDFMAELARRYEGRVFAFDHYTLSHGPAENVDELVASIPEGLELDIDLVCHSRGGLVARTLAEKRSAVSLGSRTLSIDRVVMAGTPSAGTVLADFDHFGDLADAFTNLLSFIPDNGATDVLETVLQLIKVLAVGALKGLDGLTAMTPSGAFLDDLNRDGTGAERYFALASNFEPLQPGFGAWKDSVVDVIFGQAGNDAVVPTESVYQANGSERFPISAREVFPGTSGVGHTGYFRSPVTQARLLEWLSA
jgi:hypothetical protein